MGKGAEAAVLNGASRRFARWFANEVKRGGRVAAPDGERERYMFGAFVPAVEGERVPFSEFERQPGRFLSAVAAASGLDNPVVYAEQSAGFVRVMAGSHGRVRDDLGGFILG